MSVYYLRHGETVLNTQPGIIRGRSNYTPLTERGNQQPIRLGRYLLRQGILPDVAYASPAVRTVGTGRRTLQAMGIHVPLLVHDELQELDQGEWVGIPTTIYDTPEIQARLKAEGKDFKAPGGQSMNEVAHIQYDWLLRHGNPDPDYTTFVFAHGIATGCLVGHILGWSQTEVHENRLNNTSITRLDWVDGAWQVGMFGAIPHLQATAELV